MSQKGITLISGEDKLAIDEVQMGRGRLGLKYTSIQVQVHSLTHPLIQSLTHAYKLTHTLPHSLTDTLTHSLAH